MFLKVDCNFTYRYTLRSILMHRYFYFKNFFELPTLNSLLIYFSINEVEQLEDPRTFNYFYLIRFFFGRKSFFTKFSSFFSHNKNYYSFNVQIFLNKNDLFFPLFFLSNDLLALTSSKFINYFFTPTRFDIFVLRFFDMNLFLEKKTNAGLYNLLNNLNYKFFFECSNYEINELFLISFKILW